MSDNEITLDDLLAAQSSVLKRIASDLEMMDDSNPTMGHYSMTNGHNSSGSHSSHSSGVSAAAPYKAESKPQTEENAPKSEA